MQDERRRIYHRLMMGLLDFPRTRGSVDPLVSLIRVITLLADELLTEQPEPETPEPEPSDQIWSQTYQLVQATDGFWYPPDHPKVSNS